MRREYQIQTIYPDMYHLFPVLELTPFKEVEVVISGQGSYRGSNRAHGLSFSIQPGVRVPSSLVNIYKELQTDLRYQLINHGFLESWAKQDMLLLSAALAVRAGQAYSHRSKGWEQLTDVIIEKLNERERPVVFILRGRPTQEKIKMIDTTRHVIIKSPHSGPLSVHRDSFGLRPFSQANAIPERLGETPIDWQLPEAV